MGDRSTNVVTWGLVRFRSRDQHRRIALPTGPRGTARGGGPVEIWWRERGVRLRASVASRSARYGEWVVAYRHPAEPDAALDGGALVVRLPTLMRLSTGSRRAGQGC